MADKDRFLLKVITPDRVFYEGEVGMVEFATTEGEIGVYKNHIPTTVFVCPGILVIREQGAVKKAALHAGLVEILPEKVTILAESVEWPAEVDAERAQNAKRRAKGWLLTSAEETDTKRANLALARAEVRLKILTMK